MIIYANRENDSRITNQIFENQTYLVDFEDAESSQIKNEIAKSKLSEFISWHEGNKIGELKITNYIGNIYLFGKTLNVKSNKFLQKEDGNVQFKIILDEIIFLSKNIIYSYNSPSFAIREINHDDNEPNNLLVFNYLKNLIVNKELRNKLESNIRQIIKYPTFKYTYIYKEENLEKCKNIDDKSLNLITYKMNDCVLLGDTHSHMLDLPLTHFLSKGDEQFFFPSKIWNKTYELCYDTPENRFIKYFIEFIYSTVHQFFISNKLPESIKNEIDEILHFCRRILNMSFFRNVGRMQILPTHSPALLNRQGYKDIFAHYRNCRLGIQYIIQDFQISSMSIDLKKISDLYEYWVFINIARAFLGEEVFLEQNKSLDLDNNISYNTCMKNDVISIYYNLTESKTRDTSYSVTFRPDITVVYNVNGKEFKFIFDAKYRINKIDEETSNAKNDDIYKMHAYVDAIKNVEFAFVVYPGTKFYFYEKNSSTSKKTNIDEIETFKGVGAIPLTPGVDGQYNQLEYLAVKLNEYLMNL